jgi:uncharacterized protein YjgD (DUF1641 family)
MRSQLESIRPIIKNINSEKESNEMESFQNQTLRPILKFQNSLILAVFNQHIEKHKIVFNQLNKEKQNESIERIIKNDRKLYNLLLGTIIGHFTDIEFQTYIKYQKELNRRIRDMLIQRLQNEL